MPGLTLRTTLRDRFPIPARDTLIRLNTVPVLLRTNWVKGDGNCMFGAFANAIGQVGVTNKTVRRKAIEWIRANKEDFVDFMEDGITVHAYLREMGKDGVWGDHLMLLALCKAYEVKVVVIKRMEDGSWSWNYVEDREVGNDYIPLHLDHEHYENIVTLTKVYG